MVQPNYTLVIIIKRYDRLFMSLLSISSNYFLSLLFSNVTFHNVKPLSHLAVALFLHRCWFSAVLPSLPVQQSVPLTGCVKCAIVTCLLQKSYYLFSQNPKAQRIIWGVGESFGNSCAKQPACILFKWALGRLRGLEISLRLSELFKFIWHQSTPKEF